MPQLVRERWRQYGGWLLIGLGAVAALLGWIGVSGKDIEALQLPYLASGGIGGLILTAVGAALLISADVRSDHDRAARLEAEVLELQDLVRDLAAQVGGSENGSAKGRSPSSTPRRT